jgi:hypothetical protein
MTELTIDKKQLLSFLTGFGNNVGDLQVQVEDNDMGAQVAFMSHYLRKNITINGEVKTKGYLYISELAKVVKFVKALKSEQVQLKQLAKGKLLYIIGGKSKLQLPTSATIVSASKLPLFDKLLTGLQESKWTKFHQSDLTVHGQVLLGDLSGVSKMRGILNSSPVFKVVANVDEREFVISAGKRGEARFHAVTTLQDGKGPNGAVESSFGPWLMECIALMGTGPAEIHFGDSTVLVIRQGDDMMVAIDQRA